MWDRQVLRVQEAGSTLAFEDAQWSVKTGTLNVVRGNVEPLKVSQERYSKQN